MSHQYNYIRLKLLHEGFLSLATHKGLLDYRLIICEVNNQNYTSICH